MRVKTSITLSDDLIRALDELMNEFKTRSEAIEQAVRFFLHKRQQALREQKDVDILNRHVTRLNREAEDVLDYQVDV